MTLKERVEGIVGKYDGYPLECDGFTRVAAFLLRMNDVLHKTCIGEVQLGDKSFRPHFWIELDSGEVVDYRLRMWFGDEAPHGVFVPEDEGVEYEGLEVEIGATQVMFETLTEQI
jgi:hypothetical protein